MIIGIGTDIIEIERLEKAISSEKFKQKVFGVNEIAAHGNSAASLAGNFAAKESFAKAMGCGVRGFSLAEIQVLRNSLGKPIISLHGSAKQKADELGVSEIHVSISHCVSYATAVVVLEK